MKKIYIVLVIIFILLFFNLNSSYAVFTELSFTGASRIEVNTSNRIMIKMESNKEVGIISGVLEKSSNISQINVEGKNNWNLTYNEETGEFNIYKAQGSKSDEIMQIDYTVRDEGSAEFKLSNLKVADITYTEEELKDIEVHVDVTKKQSQEKNTTNTQNTQNTQNSTDNTSKENTTNKSGNTNTSKSNTTNTDISNNSKNTMNSDNSTKSKDTNTQKIKNTSEEQKIIPKVENAKTEQKELPFTGIMEVLIPVFIVILGISGVAGYYGYKKYRGI